MVRSPQVCSAIAEIVEKAGTEDADSAVLNSAAELLIDERRLSARVLEVLQRIAESGQPDADRLWSELRETAAQARNVILRIDR